MSIIILILKIIGVILLVLLGILMLLAASILFVPIRYAIAGEIKEETFVKVRLSWLLSIIRFQLIYEQKELKKKLFIFGIPFSFPKEKKNKKKSRKKKQIKKKKETKEKKNNRKVLKETDTKTIVVAEAEKVSIETPQPDVPEETSETRKKTEKPSQLSVIKKKLIAWKQKVISFKQKICNFRKKAKEIIEIIKKEETKKAIGALFRELKYLMKHISPRKVKADISFGAEDPSLTGEIMGGLSVFPFIYKYKMRICPDFQAERNYLKGDFQLKGHARGIHLLIFGFRLLKDKNISGLLQQFRDL